MSELSAEDLRVLAEGMGYEVVDGIPEGYTFVCDYDFIYVLKNNRYYGYNPLVDNNQCMEIMEKLHININYIYENDVEAKVGRTYKSSGKTINEAVCKAALEYFKEAK